MKKNILILSILCFLVKASSFAQLSPLSSDEILKQAYNVAAKEKKNVLVIFHASWCVWCHRMDSSMNDNSCKKFFDDSYVIRHLVVDESKDKQNLENPGADDFRRKNGGDAQGIPFWLILDKDGKVLADSKIRPDGSAMDLPGDNIGCPANEKEVEYFIKLLQKTSHINAAQIDAVRTRFRMNDQ